MKFCIQRIFLLILIISSPKAIGSSAVTSDSWDEIILFSTLLKKEVSALKSLPAEFKSKYELEIKLKTKSMVLLDTFLKIKSGHIAAKGKIPDQFKINPYSGKFDEDWKKVIARLEILTPIDCNKLNTAQCSITKNPTLENLEKYYSSINTKTPFVIVNKYVLTNNWTEALRLTYTISQNDPVHKLSYDTIQRIYSFKHQGSGKVAIKGI